MKIGTPELGGLLRIGGTSPCCSRITLVLCQFSLQSYIVFLIASQVKAGIRFYADHSKKHAPAAAGAFRFA
jgi:hypothetical protein